MKQKPESANRITANIMRVVNMQPKCHASRVNTVGVWDAAKGIHRKGNSTLGVADVICCIRGRFVAFEVKAGADKQSDAQKAWAFELERAGGLYFVIRSTDEFLTIFQELLK